MMVELGREMARMKILHVCNVAGVATVIAKFMDRSCGTESHVIHRRESEKYGLTTYGEVVDCGSWRFALKCISESRKYDIIHVHDFDKLLPWLSKLCKKKPKIIHYHGSRIRNRWKERAKYYKHSSAILYSVRDVESSEMPHSAIFMPNPVDTGLFHQTPQCIKKPSSALSMLNSLDLAKAKEYAEMYGLKLTLQELGVPHEEMPNLLNKYECYIDVKTIGESTSKTGLEALTCGLRVINHNGELLEKLPEQHKPENVVTHLHELYNTLDEA